MENRINVNFNGSYMKTIFGYKPSSRFSNKLNDTCWPVSAGIENREEVITCRKVDDREREEI